MNKQKLLSNLIKLQARFAGLSDLDQIRRRFGHAQAHVAADAPDGPETIKIREHADLDMAELKRVHQAVRLALPTLRALVRLGKKARPKPKKRKKSAG